MKKTGFYLGLAFLSLTLFINCSDNDPDIATTEDNTLYKEVLTNEAAVITATYVDLAGKAAVLKDAIDALQIGNDAALQTAKEAWRAAREPWELSESFLFGPVKTPEDIDAAIDSWPVDVSEINAIFNSGIPITLDVISANEETRGFHTLEYYLWGIDGNKTASELTAREIEYLKVVALDLKNKTQYLANEWSPSGGNYSGQLINANVNNPYYRSQKDALKTLVAQMIVIADEVGTNKIEVPLNGNLGSAKPDEEESRFSKNSLLDFADNIRSIQNLYLGSYKSAVSGKGITHVIAPLNPELDDLVKAKIIAAIEAIEAIPVSFTDAIINNRSAVENAQEKVGELSEVLEKQLTTYISDNL
ncbi:MAG: imelysin [Flavobacteriaceae bacterium]|jgi:uncharacterized iron-regulated protein|nr:imelysin [Flavobacteriaceae bacterium]